MHHVNLGVLPGGEEGEIAFVTGVLGYERIEVSGRLAELGAKWFECDDGTQIHLSVDPDHRPAERAHVALDVGEDLPGVKSRLEKAAIDYESIVNPEGLEVALCRDPAGNRWELRGRTPA